VTITGTGLSAVTALKFGANPATSFTINSDTSITAVSPAGSVGSVYVVATTVGGNSVTSSANQFSYR
jgi:hypothetical protein